MFKWLVKKLSSAKHADNTEEYLQLGKEAKKRELEIVMDVVYVNGNMVPPHMQAMFYGWIVNNPTLFDDVTKQW